MRTKTACLLLAICGVIATPGLHAQPVPDSVVVEGLSFQVKPRVGPAIHYRGLALLEGAYLRFHSPDWRTNYLSIADRYWKPSHAFAVEDIPDGGKRITLIDHSENGIDLRVVYEMLPGGRLEIRATYTYAEGSPACNLEYAIAALPPAPYAGQWCDLGNGERRALPINAVPGTRRLLFGAPAPTLSSRLGDIAFSAAGDDISDFRLVDWRNYSGNMRMDSFLVSRSVPVRPGKTATLRTLIQFHPAEAADAVPDAPAVELEPAPAYEFPLIPSPRSVTRTEGVFDCSTRLRIGRPADASPRVKSVCQVFAADLDELLGSRPDVVEAAEGATGNRSLWLAPVEGEPAGLWSPVADDGWSEREEGYAIEMRPGAVALAGSDVAGLWYATRMLYQILANAHDSNPLEPRAPCVTLTNWPDHRIRGMHIPLKRGSDLGLLEQLVRCLGIYHYNALILEAHDAIRYDAHSLASAPGSYEKPQIRALVEQGRRNGLDVIPGLNSLGHVQEWLFQEYRLDRLPEFQDLIEDPSRPEIRRQRTLCPSNPRARELLFSIYDELLALYGANRFLVGLDEAFDWNKCSRCEGKNPADLFANHTNALRDYFQERGVEMVMYQDMFLKSGDWPRGVPSHSHDTAPAIDMIPADGVLMCCWQYTDDTDYPAFKYFVDKGFDCAGMAWSGPANIWGYARYAKLHGARGMFGSTWTPHGSGPRQWQIRNEKLRLAAYPSGGDAYWSPDLPATAPDDEGYDAEAEVERHYARHPMNTRFSYESVDLDKWRNWSLSDAVAGDRAAAGFDYGPGHDLSSLTRAKAGMGGVPVEGLNSGRAIALRGAWEPNLRAPESAAGITVGRLVTGIAFVHTCGWAVPRGTPVARYTIRFVDGATEVQDILYGRDILAFDSDYYIYDKLDPNRVWPSLVGRTRDGGPVRVHAFRWENNRPGVEIASIDVASAGTIAAPVLLAVATESR